MKIALFPGTFNPIHIAHLILADTARCQCNIDKIFFITSNIPPHRNKNIAEAEHRHEMVKRSCSSSEYFEASDIELRRGGTSYTYDTLIRAKEVYPNLDKLYMIIGADAISQLHTWHNAQKIADITHFLIAPRPDNPEVSCCLNKTGLKNFQYEIIKSPLLDISSTLVRDNIARGNSIKFLVLDSVKEYLEDQCLYRKNTL